MFSHLNDKNGGYATYGDNGTSKIIGECDIGTSSSKIHNILLVDGNKYYLLDQLCEKGSLSLNQICTWFKFSNFKC